MRRVHTRMYYNMVYFAYLQLLMALPGKLFV